MCILYVLAKGPLEYGFVIVNTQVLIIRLIILWIVGMNYGQCDVRRKFLMIIFTSISSVSRNYAFF